MVKEKITRILEKTFILPSLVKFRYSIRTLGAPGKFIILALFVVAFIGGVGFFHKVNNYFSVEVPLQDGVLREGIIGSPYFINPLLAISDVDRDVANLVYSGLLRSDGRGELIPDLAERYEIGDGGLSYTFFIRSNAKWHDGKEITADDVIFTIQRVKMQALKSPRRANWEGVDAEKIDEKTVRFLLKRPYAPFLENATLGIMPRHIWEQISPEQTSLSEFNTNPIGSGPYKIEKVSKTGSGAITSYTLKANDDFALGAPYLKRIILNFYPLEESLQAAYRENKIDSLSIISPKNIGLFKSSGAELKTLNLPRVFGVFFNQNAASVFANIEVRKALDLAIDKNRIVREVLSGYGEILDSPIPPGTFGSLNSTSTFKTPDEIAASLLEARKFLEKAGWKYNEKEKILEKKINKKLTPLSFSLATSNTGDLIKTAALLKEMWEAAGARVDVKIFEIGYLEQNIIRPRNYDALLFGEVVGHDPDPFSFWHSSQRNDPGLNIALYTNITVDKILEEARTISDSAIREEKYRSFQRQIKKDMPAVFLYSPYYLYLLPNWLKGVDIQNIAYPAERFSQAYKWYATTGYIWKVFAK